MNEYSDIINMPYHKSIRKERMTNVERAAQFSSFAALTGYEDAVEETARLTDMQIELSDTMLEALNRKLMYLKEHTKDNIEVLITHFVPDTQKDGGKYKTTKGTVKKIDDYTSEVVINEGTYIAIDFITGIEGEVFDNIQF